MPIKPTTNHRLSRSPPKHIPDHHITKEQHGFNSTLLSIPSETLSHITSFLDPQSLFWFGRTNKQFNEHVKDDNTWRGAFQRLYLGVGPEYETDKDKLLLLRRSESSWKKEYVLRWNLLRRWERSRNPTVAHIPHHSVVETMHMMAETSGGPALLTASLQYGVVARSQPLTGKVLKGFLDASGTVNGVGIGNPNVEFSPDVSACALTSDGGTARVLWGFINGEVAVTVAARAMDAGRAAGKLIRCKVADQHHARVLSVVWALGGSVCVTSAADGTIKVWETKRMQCLWTSANTFMDPCVKLAADLANGVVVGATRGGELIVLFGFTDLIPDEAQLLPKDLSVSVMRIPCPSATEDQKLPTTLIIDRDSTSSHTSFIVHYAEEAIIHRVTVELIPQEYQVVTFAGGPLGPIMSIFPLFSPNNVGGTTAILAGDLLGRVSIYDWSADPSYLDASSPEAIRPSRILDAHDDGGVTSLSCNAFVLVAGSSRGTIKVFDTLTFALLRSFASPSTRPAVGAEWDGIGNIVLQRDLLVVSAGSRVMAWKAGPVRKESKTKRSGRTIQHGAAKWRQQLELKDDIHQSQLALEDEKAHNRRNLSRRREHLSTLDSLGLDETEALEYVLMLSREEAEGSSLSTNPDSSSSSFEGVFQDDFQDIPNSSSTTPSSDSTPAPSPPSSVVSSRMYDFTSELPANRFRIPSRSFVGSSYASSPGGLRGPSSYRPEPMEAGRSFTATPLLASTSLPMVAPARPVPLGDLNQFPSMSPPGATSPQCWPSSSPVSRSASGSWSQGASASIKSASPSVSTSPTSRRSSDGSVGSVRPSSSSWKTALATPSRNVAPARGQSLLTARLATYQSGIDETRGNVVEGRSSANGVNAAEQEDADLKLAIELSIAEYENRKI